MKASVFEALFRTSFCAKTSRFCIECGLALTIHRFIFYLEKKKKFEEEQKKT